MRRRGSEAGEGSDSAERDRASRRGQAVRVAPRSRRRRPATRSGIPEGGARALRANTSPMVPTRLALDRFGTWAEANLAILGPKRGWHVSCFLVVVGSPDRTLCGADVGHAESAPEPA